MRAFLLVVAISIVTSLTVSWFVLDQMQKRALEMIRKLYEKEYKDVNKERRL